MDLAQECVNEQGSRDAGDEKAVAVHQNQLQNRKYIEAEGARGDFEEDGEQQGEKKGLVRLRRKCL